MLDLAVVASASRTLILADTTGIVVGANAQGAGDVNTLRVYSWLH